MEGLFGFLMCMQLETVSSCEGTAFLQNGHASQLLGDFLSQLLTDIIRQQKQLECAIGK